jgi:HSP20 family protein
MASTKSPAKSGQGKTGQGKTGEATADETTAVAPHRRMTIEDVISGLLHWNEPWFGREGHIKVEEVDEEGAHLVRAELPGVDPEKDIDVTLDHDLLTIRAERRSERTSDEGGYHRSEFSYGSFSRTIPVPAGATEDDIKATYNDGILEVRVPVDHAPGTNRRIPIARG